MTYIRLIAAIAGVAVGTSGVVVGQVVFETQDTLVLARPRVGVTVDVRARETDSIGAFIEAVAPGSPAAKAGLRASDIIVSFDGLMVSAKDDDETSGSRLISYVLRRDPSSAIPVEIRRGTVTQNIMIAFSDRPSPLLALKTVLLNSQLGRYFGTSNGLLVIDGIDDERLPLQGGDVVLQADGQAVRHPLHLLQALREAKAPVKLDVLRRRRPVIVTFQP